MLSTAEIDDIWLAAVGLRLGGSRAALLASLHPIARERLSNCHNNADQLYSDLATLRDMGQLNDGTIPLADWLATAYRLTCCHTEAEVFHRFCVRLRTQRPRPVRQRRTLFGRRSLGARSTGLLAAVAVLAAAGVAMGLIGTNAVSVDAPASPASDAPRVLDPPKGNRPGRPTPAQQRPSVGGEEGCVAQWASGIFAGTPADYRYPLLRRELDVPYLKGFELYETGNGAERIVYGVAPTRTLVEAARTRVASLGRPTFPSDCRPGLADSIQRTGSARRPSGVISRAADGGPPWPGRSSWRGV